MLGIAKWTLIVAVIVGLGVLVHQRFPGRVVALPNPSDLWSLVIGFVVLGAALGLLSTFAHSRLVRERILPYLKRMPQWLWPSAVLVLLVLLLFWIADNSSFGLGEFLVKGSMYVAIFVGPIFLWVMGKDFLTWWKSTPVEREATRQRKRAFAKRSKLERDIRGVSSWLWRAVTVLSVIELFYFIAASQTWG